MSDVPYQHPGSPPPRPEVPEGVVPAPLPPAEPADPAGPGRTDGTDRFPWWSPFAALVLAFLAATAIVGVIGVFVRAAGADVDFEDLPPGIVIAGTLLQAALLVGFAVLFAGIGGPRPTARAFGLRRAPLWRSVGLAALAGVAFYAFGLVWSLLLGISESDDLAKDLGAQDSTANLIGVAVMACVAAPIAEEVFFRGFCFPALSNRVGWLGGAIVTGMVFGAIHYGGTENVFLVPLMVFGLLLCLLYRYTGSLLPCIGLHAVNNAVALAVTLEWEVWQGLAAVVLAPALTMAIAWPFARRRAEPAAAPPG